MNHDHPLQSGLGCGLLETELYTAFNVHKAGAQTQITERKKLGHLCENRSMRA